MQCRPAITTVSLGQSSLFPIETKLVQAARLGFKAIELFYDDLEALAKKRCPTEEEPGRPELLWAAREIRMICDKLDLQILNLQPFRFFEGLVDRNARDRILTQTVPIWIDALRIFDADTILVPSNFLPPDPKTGHARTIGDRDTIVGDLRELAEIGAQQTPPVRFAYEALAWGTHVNTWEVAWEIVQAVDRPNFGLAIDTFNIAAAIYADPSSCDGTNGPTARADLLASLDRLESELDLEKLFIVQIADGERLDEPLGPGHAFYVPGQPSRMSWSRNCRLFLCETQRKGYLPVVEILQRLLTMGWHGWLAYEVFSRTLADPDPNTPANHAERAASSWKSLVKLSQPAQKSDEVTSEKDVQVELVQLGQRNDVGTESGIWRFKGWVQNWVMHQFAKVE